MWIGIAVFVVVLVVAIIWLRIRSPLPAVPPLNIPDDDPRMVAAIAEARSTIARFRELARKNLSKASVRLPIVTSSGTTEHLWGEVLRLDGDAIEIRLFTPPTTHTGEFARVRQVSLADLNDWQIETDSGSYVGGFTMRAMFAIALEQWGSLPSKLEQLRSRYSESPIGA